MHSVLQILVLAVKCCLVSNFTELHVLNYAHSNVLLFIDTVCRCVVSMKFAAPFTPLAAAHEGAIHSHMMCGEKHGSALLVFHQQVPRGSPSIGVHA